MVTPTAPYNWLGKVRGLIRTVYIDWVLLASAIVIACGGLVTMNSFLPAESGFGGNYFFSRQILWLLVSIAIFFFCSLIDWRFLRRTAVIVTLFSVSCVFLLALFILGQTVNGAQSWFQFGSFSFQPSDLIKLVLILLLAKYFAR